MTSEEIVARLGALPGNEEIPPTELTWLVERGEVRPYAAGVVIRGPDSPVDEMFILLEGRVGLFVSRGGASRRIVEAGPGTVLGVMPFSRYQKAPGDLVVDEDVVVVALNRSHFPELIRECPALTAALVHHMLDRAREFRTGQLHDERMQSIGRLASGLAHELNNPASAAARDARSLAALFAEAESAARALAAARLTDAQLEAVDALRRCCAAPATTLSALQAADREDDIAEWLTEHDLDTGFADTLARSDVSLAALNGAAAALPRNVLGTALQWVTTGAAGREVARHLETATGRIHDLVAAVKSFTFMDRQGVAEDVDIARGLGDAIAMLESRWRSKSIAVTLESAEQLPRVHGYGSDLNQVWEKLIDNAIDAAPVGGNVTVTAGARGDAVVVRIADNGAGIADEHRQRVFDPFFTTKPVGGGTGLGLDIANRLVQLHNGNISFSSSPGRTVFRVQLPAARA